LHALRVDVKFVLVVVQEELHALNVKKQRRF
jgi:hypothetical protein